MRTAILTAMGFLIAGPLPAQEDVKELVRKAVAAHGGADVINKYPAGRVKAEGTIVVREVSNKFTTEFSYVMPDKVRNSLTVMLGGQKRTVLQLQSGDKFRLVVDNNSRPATTSDIERFKQGIYVQNLVRIAPLLDDKSLTLAVAGEEKVGDQPAVGVKVTAESRDPVTLWFDKKTNLLVKTSRMGYDADGQKAPQEELFSNYQDVRGIKQPFKTVVMQNGTKFIETTILIFQPLEKIEGNEFVNP